MEGEVFVETGTDLLCRVVHRRCPGAPDRPNLPKERHGINETILAGRCLISTRGLNDPMSCKESWCVDPAFIVFARRGSGLCVSYPCSYLSIVNAKPFCLGSVKVLTRIGDAPRCTVN